MAVSTDPVNCLDDSCQPSEEVDELERQAIEELVNEAKRAKERAQTMGTYGWQKRQATTNKRFLHNTLVSTLRNNSRESRHRHKAHGHHSSRTDVESKWTRTARDETHLKSSHDEDLGHVEEGDNSKTKNGSRTLDVVGGEIEHVTKTSSHFSRPHSHTDHVDKRKNKHRGRRHSGSPLVIDKDSNSQEVDTKKHHHKHAKRHKSEKHKKNKHKDEHSRSEGHRNSKKGEKRPHKSPAR